MGINSGENAALYPSVTHKAKDWNKGERLGPKFKHSSTNNSKVH